MQTKQLDDLNKLVQNAETESCCDLGKRETNIYLTISTFLCYTHDVTPQTIENSKKEKHLKNPSMVSELRRYHVTRVRLAMLLNQI